MTPWTISEATYKGVYGAREAARPCWETLRAKEGPMQEEVLQGDLKFVGNLPGDAGHQSPLARQGSLSGLKKINGVSPTEAIIKVLVSIS